MNIIATNATAGASLAVSWLGGFRIGERLPELTGSLPAHEVLP